MIFILENTNSQINDFNSNEVNNWSQTRKVFGLKPLDGIVIGECSNENLKYDGKNLIISSQCRRISKKLHSKITYVRPLKPQKMMCWLRLGSCRHVLIQAMATFNFNRMMA